MKTITAAVAYGPGQDFKVEEVSLEEPRADEVLVKIVGVGICHSDLAVKEQHLPVPLPAVLGHEGSGIVEKVGSDVTGLAPGDHVVLSFLTCGECGPCTHEHPSFCQTFIPMNIMSMRPDGSKSIYKDGEPISSYFFGQSSFGTYALAHQSNTIKVRDDAPLELLGPLGCGIQTGAGSIMKALACEADSALVITGGGAVGLSAVLGAVVQGCSPIIVVDPMESRRALALELGATHVIDPMATDDLCASLREISPAGMNYAFDTTSIQAVLDGVIPAMAPQSTVGLVGVPKPEAANLSFNVLTLLSGISVMGITEGDAIPANFIPEMIDLYMAGKFPFDKLCKLYPFNDINEAVAGQAQGDCVKAILQP